MESSNLSELEKNVIFIDNKYYVIFFLQIYIYD